MRHRQERSSSLIQEELNKVIPRNLEFPDCLVTITKVEIDSKLIQAIVYFSVLSFCNRCPLKCFNRETAEEISQKNFESVLKILGKNRNHLQYLLAKKINIKPMPQIVFKPDYGLEKAAEVEKLLLKDKIKE